MLISSPLQYPFLQDSYLMTLGNAYFVSRSLDETDVEPGLEIIALFNITGKSVFHRNIIIWNEYL